MKLTDAVRECWRINLTVTEDELARRIIRTTADWFEGMDTDLPEEVWKANEWAARVLRQEADDDDPMAVRA